MECPFNSNSIAVIFYILTEGTTIYKEATGDESFKFTLPNSPWNVKKLYLWSYLQVKKLYNPGACTNSWLNKDDKYTAVCLHCQC